MAPELHWPGQKLRRQDKATGEQLAIEEDAQPVGLAHHGQPVKQGLLGVTVRPVGLGQHIRCAALVDVDVAGDLGDLGHELDRAGPGADDGHTPALQVDIMVPAGGMPRGAGKPVPAGDIGKGGAAELAHSADDRGRLQRAAIVKSEVPHRAALFEPGCHDPAAEA